MGTFQDLTGQRFGKLIAIRFAYIKNKKTYWEFKCDCGNTLIKRADQVYEKSSCGCYTSKLKSEGHKKHGYSDHRLKTTYFSMLDRTSKPNHQEYKNYGGRGITVCDEWKLKPNGFINFVNWAIKNGYEDNLTIDRIDVNKGYSPDNCRWVDIKTQSRNKRNNYNITYNDITHCITDWGKILGMHPTSLKYRIKKWGIEKAFNTPLQQKYKRI